MSMRIARKQGKRNPSTPERPEAALIEEPEEESGESTSVLSKALKSEEFRLDVDDDIPFQIARHLLHMRRVRGMTQSDLAKKIHGSQPHIARIENGQDNITIGTLERIVRALRARFLVSIQPEELPVQRRPHWFQNRSSTTASVEVLSVEAMTMPIDSTTVSFRLGITGVLYNVGFPQPKATPQEVT